MYVYVYVCACLARQFSNNYAIEIEEIFLHAYPGYSSVVGDL